MTAYAEAAHADELNPSRDWTVELWFKDRSPLGFKHPRARLISKGDTAGPEVPYFIGIEDGGLFAGLRSQGAASIVRYDLLAGNVDPTRWHHVAVSLNGTTRELRMYLDGVLVARGPVAAVSAGNLQPVEIGRSGPISGNYWKGEIDDVRVWNVVRTPEQILGAHRTELTGGQPGLVANWKFDEGRGVVAFDSAGLQQNAILNGEAVWTADTP